MKEDLLSQVLKNLSISEKEFRDGFYEPTFGSLTLKKVMKEALEAVEKEINTILFYLSSGKKRLTQDYDLACANSQINNLNELRNKITAWLEELK